MQTAARLLLLFRALLIFRCRIIEAIIAVTIAALVAAPEASMSG